MDHMRREYIRQIIFITYSYTYMHTSIIITRPYCVWYKSYVFAAFYSSSSWIGIVKSNKRLHFLW